MKEFVFCVALPLFYSASIVLFIWCHHRLGEEVDALSKRVDENKKMFDILANGLRTCVRNKAPLTIEEIRERLLGKSLHYVNKKKGEDIVFAIESITELSPLIETGDYLLNETHLVNIAELDALAKGISVTVKNCHGEAQRLLEIEEEINNEKD